jgi:dihydropteroate synthase-like protein
MAADGADVIDVGCTPGQVWSGVADVVQALRDQGHRVSIDSFDPREIAPAVRAGAELVLSVNSTNRDAASDWGSEVIAVPDDPHSLDGLEETVQHLVHSDVPFRIDPILEPIGFGFAASLGRYLAVRQRYPEAQMMMGVGNLTELTDVDSAAVNAILLGFCQEVGIRSVLTTQVIAWASSSVRECDLARRLMYHAVQQHVLPKHVEPRLILLRDAEVRPMPVEQIVQLAREIRDRNVRIFVSEEEIHLVSSGVHLHGRDPFALFDELLHSETASHLRLDASHAFYLGYEMCKALTATTLNKQYQQDEPLDWGFLTQDEERHYLR